VYKRQYMTELEIRVIYFMMPMVTILVFLYCPLQVLLPCTLTVMVFGTV